jgi:hypothetical protein
MSPAGCPDRKVTRVTRQPGLPGAFLKLECNHDQWLAGQESDFELFQKPRPCLSGPCYRYQTPMGRDC